MSLPRRLFILCSLILAIPSFAFADDAASRAVVNKAIEKGGGEKQLAKFKGSTSKLKGTIHLNGIPIPFTGDIASQGADQQRISISLSVDGQTVTFSSVVNRDQGWQKINDNASDMSADQLTEAKGSAYSSWVSTLLPLQDKEFKLSPFGEVEIAGRKAVGVNVTREGRRSVTLFFDRESHRLVRTESTVREDLTMKEVTEESTFSDFKDFEGIPHPTKVVIKRNGQPHADVEVEDYKPSEKLDDGLFAKP